MITTPSSETLRVVTGVYESFGRRDLRELGSYLHPQVGFSFENLGAGWESGADALLDRLASIVNRSGGTAAAGLLDISGRGESRVLAVHRETASWGGDAHDAIACVLVTFDSGRIRTLERFSDVASAEAAVQAQAPTQATDPTQVVFP